VASRSSGVSFESGALFAFLRRTPFLIVASLTRATVQLNKRKNPGTISLLGHFPPGM
jgi:F0F1-type ATP synthase assembly protein I